LREVPGIGPYTAGAIASLAFAERTPLVDGNVARVLARIDAIADDIKSTSATKLCWQRASDLMTALPADRTPGALNQALMELGALVCTPGTPACAQCPLSGQKLCTAETSQQQALYPVMPKRKAAAELPLLAVQAAWVQTSEGILLARRNPDGLFGGLWELPSAPKPSAVCATWALRDATEAVAHHQQVLSHRRLDVTVFVAELTKQTLGKADKRRYASYDDWRIVPLHIAATLGISAATAAIIAKYKDSPWTKTPKPSRSLPKATKKSSLASASSATTSKTRTSSKPQRVPPKGSTSSSTTRTKSKVK
jgi:A/G-specific adenine glycosylase